MVNAEFSRIYRSVKLLVNEGFLAVEFFQIVGKYTTGIKRLCYVKIILGNRFELLGKYLKIVLQTT